MRPPVGIEQHIPLVVLLAGRRVARELRYGETHSLAAHHLREAGALLLLNAVGGHVDELDAVVREAEGIRRHFEIDTPGHRLQEEPDSRSGSIDALRRGTEDEGRLLRLAGRDGPPADRIGETAVGHQLPGIEERQQRVELALFVAVAAAVGIFDLTVAATDQGEVVQHLAVQGKGSCFALCRKVIDRPGHLPQKKDNDKEPEKQFAETGHEQFGFTRGFNLVCRP